MNFQFAFLMFIFPVLTFCQAQSDNFQTQVMVEGDSLFNERDYEEAILKYEEALKLAAEKSEWNTFLQAGFMQAQCFHKTRDVSKAIKLSKELLAKAEIEKILPSKTSGDIWHKLGVYYYINDEYDLSQNAYRQAIQIRKKLFGENDLALSRSYHNLGVLFFAKGNYEAAVNNLRKALTIRKVNENNVLLAQTYQELGIVSLSSGDFDKGLEYQEVALSIWKNEKEPSAYDIGRAHLVIGLLNYELKKYTPALQNFTEAKSIFVELFGEADSDVADCYNNIANVYDDLKDFDKAIENYQNSLKINRELFGESSFLVARNYNNLGYTHNKNGQFDIALKYNEKALAIRQELFEEPNPAIGISYDNIGDVLVEKGDLYQAIQYYQKAITNMFADFRDTSVFANPELEKHHLIGSYEELLIFLSDKANALLKYYTASGDEKMLQSAFALFNQCHEVIIKMKQSFESDASKLFLIENAIPIYEKALETAFVLNENNPKDEYLDAAFQFMEKSKSVLLLSSRQEDKAKWIAKIPNELLSRENEFKADINYLSQLLNENLGDDSLRSILQNKLLLEKEDYQLFIDRLEKEYPSYYSEKYSGKGVDIPAVQSQLQKLQSTLVEYFIGEENLFVFVLKAEQKMLFKIPRVGKFEYWIEKMFTAVSNPNDKKLNPSDYANAAFSLYRSIWRQIENALSERIIVVPDGLLNYIPFDALLTADSKGTHFKEYPFLIKKHQISYAYSAAVMMDNYQLSKRRSPKKIFLGVAPEFKNSSNFSYLPFSIDEIENIQGQFGGEVLKGEEAKKDQFQKVASDFKIIHISSHAAAVDSNTLQSWIGFDDYSNVESDYKLYLTDLYNLKLNAEMVVLSACETSLGKLSKGEGIISLARGFAFSGCQSMITTLWPVNHSATAQIMEAFYQNLNNGSDKSKSLFDAKLSYIASDATDQNSAHPYYWSAYELVGNTNPVDIGGRTKWWIPLAGIGLIGVFMIFYFKNRKP